MNIEPRSAEFQAVFGDLRWHDAFYRFLQNVYRLYPEDRFHMLIKGTTARLKGDDEAIYRELQRELPRIKPFLADLRLAVPALARQKREMGRQTRQLLAGRTRIDGYVEIGSTGRYVGEFDRQFAMHGPLVLVNEVAPGYSPVDLVERGRLRPRGDWVPLNDYLPLPDTLPAGGFDVVSCYIGLHHAPLDRLEPFVASASRLLRPGGSFILRDHDVTSPPMDAFVSLAHAVFNAGLGVPWETNRAELRFFRPVADWVELLARHGLADSGARLLQANDPSDNVLMAFTKAAA
jgi:hypothetical protein